MFNVTANQFLSTSLYVTMVFQVRVAGRYVTILLDPHSYDSILQDTTSLDFARYAQVLMDRIFNLRLPNYEPDTEKAIMRRYRIRHIALIPVSFLVSVLPFLIQFFCEIFSFL